MLAVVIGAGGRQHPVGLTGSVMNVADTPLRADSAQDLKMGARETTAGSLRSSAAYV
jgi:hypothetical protein